MANKKDTVSLTDLLNPQEEQPKKKGYSLIEENFLNKKTPEEIAEWRKRASIKRKATLAEKKRHHEAIIEKARDLMPQVMAFDLASKEFEGQNFTPSQETIDKLKYVIDKKNDLPIETIRKRFFKDIPDETWHRLMKFVFKSQVSQTEDLGAELMRAKLNHLKRLKAQAATIRREIKLHKKKSSDPKMATTPVSLLQMAANIDDKIFELEKDVPKVLNDIGAVGEKSKAPSLHLHMSIPRPPKKEEKVVSGD